MANIQDVKSFKFIIFIALISVSVFFFIWLALNGFDISVIHDYLVSTKVNSFFVVLGVTIVSASFGFPIIVPISVAVFLYNGFYAFLITYVGMIIGSSVSFFLSRFLGRQYVEIRFITRHAKLKNIDKMLKDNGFYTGLIARLIMVLPFEAVNVLSGLSKMEFKDFLFSTIIGLPLGNIVTIYLLESISQINPLQIFIASLLMSLFVVAPFASKKIRKSFF